MDKIFVDEVVTELHTILDMLRWTVSRFHDHEIFYGHGTDNAWDEAIQLILPTLHLPLDIDPSVQHARLTRSERHAIAECVIRRIYEKQPAPYLTHRAYFAGLEFFVDERVLIPRSPIGELIEKEFQPWLKESPKRILDLCTGSGCIAIACAVAFPEAEVDAVDISQDALDVAEINIQNYALEQQVIPLKSDLFRDLPRGECYDLIVTNPPYVDAEDMDSLPTEFTHEPALALAAGSDGLKCANRIFANAADYLNEGGLLVLEVGNSQVHLEEQYPDVPFLWVELERGGHGILVMTREELLTYQDRFALYKD